MLAQQVFIGMEANKNNKHNLDIDVLVALLAAGFSYRELANKFNCPATTIWDFCHRNTSPDGNPANSPRAKAADALVCSADMYAEMAEEVLKAAENKPSSEVHRASYLSSHYRWMASKRNPKMYGTSVDYDIHKTTKVIKVSTKASDVANTSTTNPPPNEAATTDNSMD